MVTGVKPDEQVDWCDVELAAAGLAAAVKPLVDALEGLAVSIFGVPLSDLPRWMDELWRLEAAHAEARLRGRARRRLASLRKRERAWERELFRRYQRRVIGVRGV